LPIYRDSSYGVEFTTSIELANHGRACDENAYPKEP
jgi:hypothetical protein